MLDGGIGEYFMNVWNLMDWLNYLIFFFAWYSITQFLREVDSP